MSDTKPEHEGTPVDESPAAPAEGETPESGESTPELSAPPAVEPAVEHSPDAAGVLGASRSDDVAQPPDRVMGGGRDPTVPPLVTEMSDRAFVMPDDANTADVHISVVSDATLGEGANQPLPSNFDSLELAPSTLQYRAEADTERPSLATLRFGPSRSAINGFSQQSIEDGPAKPAGAAAATKFGWVKGVWVRCMLNIWGVIMFLRLGWVVGQAGIGFSVLIILVSMAVTAISALSLSAICTNGEVKGGGAYYLISRSLGPEFGGAIGLLFSCANAVAIALYVVGFAETFAEAILGTAPADPVFLNQVRLVGVITGFVLLGITLVGMDWEAKVQLALLALLIVSIICFFVGAVIPTSAEDKEAGFVGFEGTPPAISANFGPGFQPGESFFSVLAVFFPACTGIMAGANISGDLKDPQVAIPKGTLYAILVSGSTYVAMAVMVGAVVTRAGLQTNLLIMTTVSVADWIIIAGIFAATLSSGLASLVGAPRIFQALARDKLFPIGWFAKGYGPSDDPKRGYFLAFAIGLCCILIGKLNAIAPLITNFFLISYALINYACFAASYSLSPGWRPSFRWYNQWVALLGTVLCIVIMFLIDWVTSLITVGLAGMIFQYLAKKKPDVNWGSANQAQAYVSALRAAHKLNSQKDHVKNFRPQFLVLTPGNLTEESKGQLQFISHMAEEAGLITVGSVRFGQLDADGIRSYLSDIRKPPLTELVGIRAFSDLVVAESFRNGCQQLMMLSGLGKMRPNTVVLGYKKLWMAEDDWIVENYVGVIRDAMDLKKAVCIMRDVHQLDFAYQPIGDTIDIWWLVDDGGLTILLPHLLQKYKYWEGRRLRLFGFATSDNITGENMRMVRMLRKFRIKAEVTMLQFPRQPPTEETMNRYNTFGVEYDASKTARYLAIGELLRQHSSKASIVFLTLPVPKVNVTARQYLSWIESMTYDLPPVVLIRGNQESVLTFYS